MSEQFECRYSDKCEFLDNCPRNIEGCEHFIKYFRNEMMHYLDKIENGIKEMRDILKR
ncbi:MAG: hypothetical protein J7K26_03550 [Candidatus Aenigmarchaeota archaeon]|nr:hypothetical protein [Candidatus Aenigmarchaeota archaeon]